MLLCKFYLTNDYKIFDETCITIFLLRIVDDENTKQKIEQYEIHVPMMNVKF